MTTNLETRINADFATRVVLDTARMDWVASPLPGVERRMLDRVGDEVARATSIVRYAPGSRFSEHVHDMGEEFVVLDGVFSDEHGDYAAGTYIRNPPATRHTPHSDAGCTIFVKLRQFDARDRTPVCRDVFHDAFEQRLAPGVAAMALHRFGDERVDAVQLAAGARWPASAAHGGSEVLVLAGAFADEHGEYGTGSWLREPPGMGRDRHSAAGALLFVKTGHLAALL